MHNIIKILIAALLSVITCGCAKDGKTEYKTDEISLETDKYSINGEMIILGGSSDGITEFNDKISEEVRLWQEDFENRVNNTAVLSSTKPTLQFSTDVQLNRGGIISVTTDKYVYISALHGNTWRSARTYNSRYDKTLNLSDLFIDSNYTDFLTEKLNELITEKPDIYHDLWEQPSIDKKREDKFYLDGKNLVIFYEPYELSYYARGVVEFPVNTEKLRGYIKEVYLSR